MKVEVAVLGSPPPPQSLWFLWALSNIEQHVSEFKSCVNVEVAVLSSPRPQQSLKKKKKKKADVKQH